MLSLKDDLKGKEDVNKRKSMYQAYDEFDY